jgi:hypothetical protein
MTRQLVLTIAALLLGAIRAPSAPAQDPVPLAEADHARAALSALTRAYEQADLAGVRALLDPGFIGLQHFLDAIQRDFHALRFIRIHLEQPRVIAGPDVAVIQAGWEKRFVDAVTFRPALVSGQVTVLMHRTPSGWRLAALSGDSPFGTVSAPASPVRSRRGTTATGP